MRIMIVYKKLIISSYPQSKKISFHNPNQNFLLPLLIPIVNTTILYCFVDSQVTQNLLDLSFSFFFINFKIFIGTIDLYSLIWYICNVDCVNSVFLLSCRKVKTRFNIPPHFLIHC